MLSNAVTIVDLDEPPPHPYGAVGPPWFSDRTVFVVGGGPSLIGFDFDRLPALGHVIGVNRAMFDAPAQCGVSMDIKFVNEHRDDLDAFARRNELYLGAGRVWWRAMPVIERAIYLREDHEEGLSLAPDRIRTNLTSGYTALNLAVLKRARRIVLLGFDYGAAGGRHHYHNRYPWFDPTAAHWPQWAQRFEVAAQACQRLGIEVINASPDSAIVAFPRVTIEDCLRDGHR